MTVDHTVSTYKDVDSVPGALPFDSFGRTSAGEMSEEVCVNVEEVSVSYAEGTTEDGEISLVLLVSDEATVVFGNCDGAATSALSKIA